MRPPRQVQHSHKISYEYLGRPQKTALQFETWKGGELVEPMEVPESLLGEAVYLGDFGLAIKAGTSLRQKVQSPAVYCAPERFHDADRSFATDIWSYMCLFVQLYLGFNPFYGVGNASSGVPHGQRPRSPPCVMERLLQSWGLIRDESGAYDGP
jgi:serine/threonine protein kinase